jgi:hypothetical protein
VVEARGLAIERNRFVAGFGLEQKAIAPVAERDAVDEASELAEYQNNPR